MSMSDDCCEFHQVSRHNIHFSLYYFGMMTMMIMITPDRGDTTQKVHMKEKISIKVEREIVREKKGSFVCVSAL